MINNKLMIIGNLTRDPELRKVTVGSDEVSVCTFTVAVNKKTGETQKTTYFRVTSWRGMADNCMKYLQKGRKVAVEGEVSASCNTSDGRIYVNLEVNASDVMFLDGAKIAEDTDDGIAM